MDSAILEQERISFSIALDQRGVDCRNGAPHLLSALIEGGRGRLLGTREYPNSFVELTVAGNRARTYYSTDRTNRPQKNTNFVTITMASSFFSLGFLKRWYLFWPGMFFQLIIYFFQVIIPIIQYNNILYLIFNHKRSIRNFYIKSYKK